MTSFFRIDTPGDMLDRAETVLSHIPGGFQKASMRAINAAVTAGRTAASVGARATYTAKASKIKSTVSIRKASSGTLEAELKSKGPPLNLKHFQHRPATDTTGGNRRSIRVSVKKGSAKALATGFISSKLHGNVFTRVEGERRIRSAVSVAVPQMIENAEVREKLMHRMDETLNRRLEHEVGYILSKGKA